MTPVTHSEAGGLEIDDSQDQHTPITYDNCHEVAGPFYHGTKSALDDGTELVPGYTSNFQQGRVSNNIYFTTLVETAAWERSWQPRWRAVPSAVTSTSSNPWARSRTTRM